MNIRVKVVALTMACVLVPAPVSAEESLLLADASSRPSSSSDQETEAQGQRSSGQETVGDSNLTGWQIALIVLATAVLAPPLLVHLFYAVL